ncbi:CDP-alcohol phosphatidyltransferase family protein [Candidatus Formimonas warabiya]|uniref:CDP-alcohol phosphatidyltransferase n=1 Tax=Formimonas warabiya TaxID=1761012 RepID=A0A3G1KV86_FORW1|nr:CDP-alcohol phosphatidyltransferase family protein [Candidatus Formimonas warabiya]ATW26115.1 CDP-alcohol phosphatidyltransferase [Candidatus Formimonas warabiya]
MLDTRGRKFVDPVIQFSAKFLLKKGFSANLITWIAFVTGILSGPLVWGGYPLAAVIILWVSGFLDAVDGALARMTKPSPWGTVLDVTFDRMVEISVILGLAFRFPQAAWSLLLLSVSIIISMTVFLTVGAVTEKKGMKSFYYQPGLAERTEGFIMFSLMMVFTGQLVVISLAFFGMILFTAGQRLLEAKRLLTKEE